LGTVKWVYIGLIGILLLAFPGGRTYDDFQRGNVVLLFVDLAISVTIIIYFVAYARSSVFYDSPKKENNKT
jgi:hypothetical protein